ncbi:hypothetical protein C8Q77DRAFT_1272713 [Trametes polyzona]|nr:hypothetical protein C8Q77DRAFT_1272713 [Trametes polyzona]
MGTTVLCEPESFKTDVLPPVPVDNPSPSLPDSELERVKLALHELFYNEDNTHKKPKEDIIAEVLVKLINSVGLPGNYAAALSRYKANSSDSTKSKVDAAIYPAGRAPLDGAPNWTHCRFWIEFKRGGSEYDPWDDRVSKEAEAARKPRAAVRAQLTAYTRNVFLYQQRTALFTLFINGQEFRTARWDRSGVIVTRKVNYVQDPQALFDILRHLTQLNDEQQGLDPTATLIEPGTMAFKVMDELALPNDELDMDYDEGITVELPPPTGTERSQRDSYPFFDPSGEHPDPDFLEIEEVDDDPRIFKYVRDKFRKSLEEGWPRYKLRIGDRVFLVAKPLFTSSTMFGRGTHGWIAVDVRTGRFVFLKDSWRPFYEGVEPEGTYLEKFADNPNIIVPAVLCHGDVQSQRAFTAVYEANPDRRKKESLRATQQSAKTGKSKRKHDQTEDQPQSLASDPASTGVSAFDEQGSLRHHVHYRIALKDVCLPFEEFRTTRQFIRLMHNCIKTHYWVYEEHGLLHRDISAGNILILPRVIEDGDGTEIVAWVGVLTDWELAKSVKNDPEQDKARQPERTGTWQFMSVASVESQWTQPVKVADELESFFHVMLFYAVRFIPHTIPGVSQFVINYFDTFRPNGSGGYLCSGEKSQAVRRAEISSGINLLQFTKTNGDPGNPLNTLIANFLELIEARYKVLDHRARQEQTVSTLKETKAPSSSSVQKVVDREALFDALQAGPGSRNRTLKTRRPVAKLPDAVITRAALLDNHEEVLSIFKSTSSKHRESDWAHTEAVEDQLVGYEPRLILLANIELGLSGTGTQGTSESLSKRIKSSGTGEPVPVASASQSFASTGGSAFSSAS